MFAPNLVYATVAGRYPRLLAEDGIREPLIVPFAEKSDVLFEFYAEGSKTPIPYNQLMTATYIAPDGSSHSLQHDPNTFMVEFNLDLAAGGLCLLSIAGTDGKLYHAYPFRVLRPTTGLTP